MYKADLESNNVSTNKPTSKPQPPLRIEIKQDSASSSTQSSSPTSPTSAISCSPIRQSRSLTGPASGSESGHTSSPQRGPSRSVIRLFITHDLCLRSFLSRPYSHSLSSMPGRTWAQRPLLSTQYAPSDAAVVLLAYQMQSDRRNR